MFEMALSWFMSYFFNVDTTSIVTYLEEGLSGVNGLYVQLSCQLGIIGAVGMCVLALLPAFLIIFSLVRMLIGGGRL